ncbi:hypothetical protein [Streptomyces sp. NBC_01304]|uniref:hypothetical protein n=1 Tax=Streptomyces sp. NBC_01304 TaxID=2903818 RepID=UPI002E13BFCE|nr:hypothetical protein OG430_15070 [Streptomyces sp. NBC_01304]
MTWRDARWGLVLWGAAGLVLGSLWWWAVLRLALVPEGSGVLEGAVVAGGWGLGLLPVHCVPWRGRSVRAGSARAAVSVVAVEGRPSGSGAGQGRAPGSGTVQGRIAGSVRGRVAKAWRRRRSG